MKPSIDDIWSRIKSVEGAGFQTKTALPFTYKVSGETLTTSRTQFAVSKTDFARALKVAPIAGPGQINWSVRGPAYIWPILHDQRIRQEDW